MATIHFYSPMNFEPWDWRNSTQGGIGGSETSHVEMAWRLARRGHDVTSYTWIPDDCPGEWRNTKWLPLKEADFSAPGLWIMYRAPHDLKNFEVAHPDQEIWLMCQDEDYGAAWTDRAMDTVDKVLALCKAHRKQIVTAHPPLEEKTVITSNGVKMDLIREIEAEGFPERNPHKLIYASSPDRGLVELLKIFPRARERVPDLELVCFYGFNNIEKLIKTDPKYAFFKQLRKDIEEAMDQPGVTWRGRVSQNELYREFLSSGIWCYPSEFCVTGETLIDMPRNYAEYPRGVPIKDLVGRSGFPVWCFDLETEQFRLAPVKWVKKTRKHTEVWRVDFDDGTYLRATPDHKVLLRHSFEWIPLKDLQPDDSILHFGKHMQVQVGIQGGRKGWPTEHRMLAEYLFGRSLKKGEHVDHIDGDCWNNAPENIQILSAAEHARKSFAGKRRLASQTKSVRRGFKKWYDNLTEEEREEFSIRCVRAARTFWDSMNEDERKAFIVKRSETQKDASRQAMKAWWAAMSAEEKERRKEALKLGPEANRIAWQKKMAGRANLNNHRVLRVRPDGHEDVYDLLVDGPHNFVANGVVVHNSETSCITCMEAQCLGAIPITNPYWALGENVKYGVFLPGFVKTDRLVQARYAEAIVRVATDVKAQDELREKMILGTQYQFNWERWVDQWETWIYDIKEPVIVQWCFQRKHSRGKILNIGSDGDLAGFGAIGAVNLDVNEKHPTFGYDTKADVIADARSLPEDLHGQFDTVVVGDMLEHMTPDDGVIVLQQAKKCLNNGGRVVITSPDDRRGMDYDLYGANVKPYAEGVSGFHRPLPREELEGMLAEADLEPVLIHEIDYTYFMGWGVIAC